MSKRDLIYFIIAGDDVMSAPRCKIGFTSGNPMQRLRNLQCGSPVRLRLFCYFDGSKKAEQVFHDTFAPLRLHGEWFAVEGKLKDFLFYLADDAQHGGEVSGELLCIAVCDVILAECAPHPNVNETDYLASVDTRHWDSLREPLANDIAAGRW